MFILFFSFTVGIQLSITTRLILQRMPVSAIDGILNTSQSLVKER